MKKRFWYHLLRRLWCFLFQVLVVVIHQQQDTVVNAFVGSRCHYYHHEVGLPPLSYNKFNDNNNIHQKQKSALFISTTTVVNGGEATLLFPTEEKEISNQQQQQQKKKTRRIKRTTKRRTWDESYNLLLEYYKEHGDANVPYGYKKDPKLGIWMRNQRSRRCSLPANKVAKLDELGIAWEGSREQRNEMKWETMFNALKEYKKQHDGNCNVPIRHKHQKLARWVQNQRKFYREGQLPSHRIQRLEGIDFVWRQRAFQKKGPKNDLWLRRYQQLLDYKSKFGDCRVPQIYSDNPSLGKWVSTQKVCHVEGRLSPQRKQLLEEANFTWSFDEIWDEQWMNKYNQLKEFLTTNDDNSNNSSLKKRSSYSGSERIALSPRGELELWHWERFQQDKYMMGTLDPKRESLLEEIQYWELLGLEKESNRG